MGGGGRFFRLKAWAFLGLLAFCGALQASPVVFKPSDARLALSQAAELVRACSPRDAGTAAGRRAADLIRLQAVRQGVKAQLDPFTAQSGNEIRTFVNVVAELPARRPAAPWIVLMSHFDTKPGIKGFQGANDGASTSGLLVALAGALHRAGPFSYNICLAWTDAEECRTAYAPNDGFQGSRHLVQTFRRKGRPVKAAICLDMLGDRDLDIVMPANSSPALRALAMAAAQKAGFSKRLSFCEDTFIGDDHSAFFDAGYPALDLIDFSFGSAPGLNDYWHTPQDTLDRISSSSLFISGRIVAELMNLLVSGTF